MNKRLIHSVFDSVAQQFPSHIAIESEVGKRSYAQLKDQTDRMAQTLVANEVTKGERVVVLATPGPDLIAMILAVFKSGNLYVPIDQNFGENRLKQVFEEAFDGTLLASKQDIPVLKELLGQYEMNPKHILLIDNENIERFDPETGKTKHLETQFDGSVNLPDMEEEDSCYIFYTSGSTGKAKGILGRHESLSQFIHWEIEEFQVDETMRVSQLVQPTFDASLRDIFVPLCAGATLCIPSVSTKTNFVKLWQWIKDSQVSTIHTVPSIFRQLSKELPASWDPETSQVKYLIFSGEPLFSKDVRNCQEILEGVEVVNFYGMTETTMIRAFHRVTAFEDGENQKVPAGKPIAKTAVAIINGNRLCRVGEIGEIYIKSPFFSNGYLDSTLNKDVFVQNPLVQDREDIVYKTGDLGRYKKDKTFEVLGRMDNQVKINGVRMDLSEVEKVALEVKQIDQVFLKAQKNDEGSTELIGYFTGEKEAAELLKDHLRKKLSAYIVPNFLVHLESFPLNLNGKIDGKALPDPASLSAQEQAYEEPIGSTEEVLAGLWSTILGLDKIGRKHSFFDLGGHSLRAIRLVSNIYNEFNVQLKLADVFETKTLESLAALIEARKNESVAPIPKAEEKPYYPLSHGQKRLWAIHQMDKATQAYVIPSAFHLRGELNAEHLKAAINLMVYRYEILRTRFPMMEGKPVQFIDKEGTATYEFIETILQDADAWQNQAKDLVDAEYERYFDLENGPLWAVHLIKCGEQENLLVVNMHHILTDAWSTQIFFKELIQCYQALGAGEEAELSLLKIQYRDYSEWQHQEMSDPRMLEAAEYWKNQFQQEVLALELPTDNPRPTTRSYEGGHQTLEMSGDVVRRLKAACKKANTTLFTGLLAAVKVLLFRYTQQKDMVVGVPVSGRDHPDLENQIGFFVNTLALRSEVKPDQSFASFLSEARQTVLNGFKHQCYPFDKLINEITIAPDPSRSPLFDVMVDVQEISPEDELDTSKEKLDVTDIGGAAIAKFDWLFNFTVREDSILLTLTYDKNLYRAASTKRLVAHFEHLLTALLAGGEHLDAISYMQENEREQLLSRKGAEWPVPEGTITDWLENNEQHKDHIAIVDGQRKINYGDLVQAYQNLAGFLIQKRGVVSGEKVALIQGRSANTIIGMLGILRSGASFVPIDPDLPKERIKNILDEINCRTIVSEVVNPEDFEQEVVNFNSVEADGFSKDQLPTLDKKDAAYVIYTSGSTGTPKGVLIGHDALANYAFVCNKYFELTAEDKVLHQSSIAFDTFVEEIFPVFLAGGQVVVHAGGGRDVEGLVELVQTEQVSVVSVTPLIINELNAHVEKLNSLRILISGGDKLLPGQIDKLFGKINIYNTYGPSETTVCATYGKIEQLEHASLIGEALPNAEVLVLDVNGALVPEGISGEIYIGGAGLAQGYLNNPESTANRFVSHPFVAGELLYKTGDLGRWTSDGLTFIGRNDDQVKVRGYRVELPEVEQILLKNPGIKEAAVCKIDDRLVCYYVGQNDESLLIQFAQDRLPFYMIPAQWLVMDQLPRTISGKVDRKSLPDPGRVNVISYESPKQENEKLMVSVWEKVLGKPRVGITDNFYELGGDSIKAIQVVSRLHQAGIRLEVRDILTYPTIKALAPMASTAKIKATSGEVTGTVDISPIHQAFFESDFRYPDHYNQSILLFTAKGWNVSAIEEAFKHIINHHDGLRSKFQMTDGNWRQHISKCTDHVPIEVVDFHHSENPTEEMLTAAERLQSNFKLDEGPLFKLGVFRHEEGEYLLLTAHHLLVDGVSWRIIMEDFSTLYRKLLTGNGNEVELPAKTSSLMQWMTALEKYANSSQARERLLYWEQVMEQVQESAGKTGTQENIISRVFELDEEKTQLLQGEVHVPYKTKTDELLMAATLSAMQNSLGKSKCVIALEGHGRESISKEIDINRTVGWFTSVFPVVLQADESGTEGSIIGVKEALRKIPNHGFDFGVLKYLSKNYDVTKLQKSWRADLSFNYLGEFGFSESEGYFSAVSGPKGSLRNAEEKNEYPISLDAFISDGRLTIAVAFDDWHFTKAEIDQFMISLEIALLEVIDHCLETTQTVATPSDFEYSDLSLEELDTLFD